MRTRLDEGLYKLNTEILEMARLVEKSMGLIETALGKKDQKIFDELKAIEQAVDSKESKVQSLCLRLIINQQPVAGDFRKISAALKMITDMERIADQARDISYILEEVPDGHESLDRVVNIAKASRELIESMVKALIINSVEESKKVIDMDDRVDNEFIKLKEDLIVKIRDNSYDGQYVFDIIMIAKYFERIADHGVNIAEWIIFSIEGE